MRALPINHRIYPWLAALAGLIMVARLAASVSVFSATTDETFHIGSAVSMVEAGKQIAGVSHPPLTRWVAVAPLWLDGARLRECRQITKVGKEDVAYALGTRVLYQSPTPAAKMLAHARLAMLIFPVLTLLFLYLLGKYLANGLVAFVAVLFCSVDPTVLGHGFWIATDAAAAAAFLAALYCGIRWLRTPTWANTSFLGLAIGLAAATKYSCLAVLPALGLIALVELRREKLNNWSARARQFAKSRTPKIALAALVAFASLWATYQFNLSPLGDQDVMGQPAAWERLPGWVRTTPVPMPSFFLGFARLAAHDHFGQLAYLNGNERSEGWWYYFPELLLIKSPLGFLAALLLGVGIWVRSGARLDWPTGATLIPAGLFLGMSMLGKIDIGIRHVLPIIPLLYLFVAAQLARPKWIWALACFIFIGAVETAVAHPNYLSFFNAAVGGAANGDRYALDSNLDWGQDVNRLADWIKANANNRPYAIRLSGRRNKPLLKSLGLDENSLEAPVHGRTLCISKSARLLEGKLPWLAHRTPIAVVGDSIEIYDLTGPSQPDEPEDSPSPDEPATAPAL